MTNRTGVVAMLATTLEKPNGLGAYPAVAGLVSHMIATNGKEHVFKISATGEPGGANHQLGKLASRGELHLLEDLYDRWTFQSVGQSVELTRRVVTDDGVN